MIKKLYEVTAVLHIDATIEVEAESEEEAREQAQYQPTICWDIGWQPTFIMTTGAREI